MRDDDAPAQAAVPPSDTLIEGSYQPVRDDYREYVRLMPTTRAMPVIGTVMVVLCLVLIALCATSGDTEPLVLTVVTAAFAGLCFGYTRWMAAMLWRAAVLREHTSLRLTGTHVASAGVSSSQEIAWTAIRRAKETDTAFHLDLSTGLVAIRLMMPKRAFRVEEHAAVRQLIREKVSQVDGRRRPAERTVG
ncbi:hypothetical protein [Myceligenerans crystallogenes]|uniref:YcxB-like protein n=1 Tax=Myceligenerans crystallogenes TaxID=316335 RepID=A0ABP4ZTI7_9MICO